MTAAIPPITTWPFVVRILDVETTGLNPALDRVVEVATVDISVHEDGEITRGEMWSSLINPAIPIPPEASAVHDIVDEMVADAPAFADVVDHLKRGPPHAYCAHNNRFDEQFFKPADIPWLDTYRIAIWIWPEAPNHTAACLRYWLKLRFAEDIGQLHRAKGDAYIAAAILRRALTVLTKDPDGPTMQVRLQQLFQVSNEPAVLPKFTFGEHAMKPIATVPSSYLEWILSPKGIKDNEDVRFTAFNELNRRRQTK